jgi:hypothetical protein
MTPFAESVYEIFLRIRYQAVYAEDAEKKKTPRTMQFSASSPFSSAPSARNALPD